MHSVQRLRNELDNRNIVKLFQAEERNFFLLHKIQDGCSVHPASYSVGVKYNGYEAYHSPPSGGEFKNEWNYISPPHTPSWRVQRHLKFYSAY